MKGVGKRQLILSYNRRILVINGIELCCEEGDDIDISYNVTASKGENTVYSKTIEVMGVATEVCDDFCKVDFACVQGETCISNGEEPIIVDLDFEAI